MRGWCRNARRAWSSAIGVRGDAPPGPADGANAEPLLPPGRQPDGDATIRNVLGDLAVAEAAHEQTADAIDRAHAAHRRRASRTRTDAKRRFVLQIIQPGLVGLMDGSVSTLAPVFAAAFATHSSWNAFLVGLAASLGAGISMGFAEALADDGKLSGRGTPLLRGVVCGLMTIAGGIGHTLPYLIPDFLDRHVAVARRGRVRVARHRLDPVALHGHSADVGGGQGHARRRPRPGDRHSHRQQPEPVSRAFVSEDAADAHASALPERPVSPHPNLVTPSGLAAIDARIAGLQAERAALAADAPGQAHGDGRPRVDRDLRYWRARRSTARLQPPGSAAPDEVAFGAWVSIRRDGTPARYRIVGEDEADPARGLLGWTSPLARALLGARVGETVDLGGGRAAATIEAIDADGPAPRR